MAFAVMGFTLSFSVHIKPVDAVRALSEGRNALFRDALMGVDLDDPALWGGLTLFGKP